MSCAQLLRVCFVFGFFLCMCALVNAATHTDLLIEEAVEDCNQEALQETGVSTVNDEFAPLSFNVDFTQVQDSQNIENIRKQCVSPVSQTTSQR